jgi:DNA-binding NtrC family response regulator
MSGDDDDLTLTLRSFQAQAELRRQDERCYLLVFETESSSIFHLPPAGEVVVGRAPEAHLRVQESSASRHHAKFLIAEDEVRVLDLNSHNGTRVNGERVTSSRLLASGDAISIAPGITMVFHREDRLARARNVLDPVAARKRLEEELERSLRYKCPLTVVSLAFGEGQLETHRKKVLGAVGEVLRLIDVVAWDGERMLAMLPELSAREVGIVLGELGQALERLGVEVRLGWAVCPSDGSDPDTLLAGARVAADAAVPGRPSAAAEGDATITLGERQLVVADPAMVRLYALLKKLAASDVPVLISGETGSGKEIASTALHAWSKRKDGPLVTLNCAALPEHLIESELFGFEKGAFSGAQNAKPGLLESASGGTLFLDELGELPLPAQAKLLRALETQKVMRLGEVRERPIDIRLVAATNRNLEEESKAGRFRQDLFFRLSTARVILPPLRHRRRELPALARALLREACEKGGRPPMTISPGAMQKLLAHPWPGNVRELKNALDFAAATAQEVVLQPWDLPESVEGSGATTESAAPAAGASSGGGASAAGPAEATRQFRPIGEEVAELERDRMAAALAATGGVQTRAAELISMPLRTFVTKLKQYNLSSRR